MNESLHWALLTIVAVTITVTATLVILLNTTTGHGEVLDRHYLHRTEIDGMPCVIISQYNTGTGDIAMSCDWGQGR